MHFFFRLSERKRCQKERTSAVPVGLLRAASCLKGRNSLRSDSLPFLTASGHPSLYARRSMPENHAASNPHTMREERRAAFRKLESLLPSAAWLAPKRRGVKRRIVFNR